MSDNMETKEPAINEELKSYELEICSNDDNTLYIRTFEDRTVGIYGYVISPQFKNMKELVEWWTFMKEFFIESD